MISSALDYKRFLDRRKQMIQQQVESAHLGEVQGGGKGKNDTPSRKVTHSTFEKENHRFGKGYVSSPMRTIDDVNHAA